MGKQEKPPKPKEYSLTNVDISEISFVAEQAAAKEEELNYWRRRMEVLQNKIKDRWALNKDNIMVDFGQVFSTRKIFAYHVPKPKVVPQEGKKDDPNSAQTDKR